MALAISTLFHFLIILAAILISAAAATSPPPATNHRHTKPQKVAAVLSSLGYHQLSSVAAESLPTTTTTTTFPLTIFAPSDNSILTCPSCSLSLLLLEHSIPSLYPISLLLSLPFGTKIQTLSPKLRCLTLTSSGISGIAFINGAEITRPELFKNNRLIVHGVQGFMSHLSPLSCNVESLTSLSFPPDPTPFSPFFMMRLMLRDAMLRLRISGYSVLALAMRERYKELIELQVATVFALDDESVFGEGHAYVRDLRFHIVPNRRLTGKKLVALPPETVLSTMDQAEKLVITTAGGGGILEPVRINYVKVKNLDLMFNDRIAVHGLAGPLMHVLHDPTAEEEEEGLSQSEWSSSDGNLAPTPVIGAVDADDYHTL